MIAKPLQLEPFEGKRPDPITHRVVIRVGDEQPGMIVYRADPAARVRVSIYDGEGNTVAELMV